MSENKKTDKANFGKTKPLYNPIKANGAVTLGWRFLPLKHALNLKPKISTLIYLHDRNKNIYQKGTSINIFLEILLIITTKQETN